MMAGHINEKQVRPTVLMRGQVLSTVCCLYVCPTEEGKLFFSSFLFTCQSVCLCVRLGVHVPIRSRGISITIRKRN